MHISCTSNNGIQYLKLVKSAKGKASNGEYKQIKKTILNIGPLHKFDDNEPDYIKRLRTSFKEGKPIIDSLTPHIEGDISIPISIDLKFNYYEECCQFKPEIYSNALLDQIFKQLGLTHYFSRYKSDKKLNYDLLGVIKLLTYGRILNPESKIATFSQKDDYYGEICKCDNPYIVYEALDVLANKRTNILQTMNNAITKNIGRSQELVFYDVTNFYYEIEQADEDEEVNGELVKGLRQRGVSKENKKSPIVQTGLFMDENGLPISFETFPGNALDQTTLRPALKNTINDFGLARFILVADKGLNSQMNIAFLVKEGNGYIISKSIPKSKKEIKEWILDEIGYTKNTSETFKVKSKIIDVVLKDEKGNEVKTQQKIVSYWSEKFYKKQYNEHKSFLDFIEKLKENPENFRAHKLSGGYLKKFLKKEVINTKTDEKIKNKDLLTMLDEKKLEALTAYMGYYTITTSEINMDDLEIISKYRGLTKIEDQFRVMKSDLNSRPIYVSTRDHINAHFTICFIALTIARLIQHKIKEKNNVTDTIENWQQGLPVKRIQKALNSWQIEELAQGHHRFRKISSDLNVILNAYEVNIVEKLYTAKELKELKGTL